MKERKSSSGPKTKRLKTQNPRRYSWVVLSCLSIAVVGLLAYSNSLDGPFQWDEHDFLVENPIIKNPGYFLTPSKAKDADPDYYYFLKTRFVGYFTFLVNYQIHGFRVLGYHLVNLVIHLLNGLLVFHLILLSLKTPFLETSVLKKDSNLVALFGALLFVAHPLQTEAVTYIFQRHASLVTFFCLVSLAAYVRGRLGSAKESGSRFRSALPFIVSMGAAALAMKTKENAFTLPILILVYEFFFFEGKILPRLARLLPWLACLSIIPFTLKGLDRPIEWMIHPLEPAQAAYQEQYGTIYLLTQMRVIVTYLRLLFLPIHQNLYYDYPVSTSFFSPPVLLSCFLHLLLLGLAVYLFYRSRAVSPGLRLVAFGIFWFYATLSVESSIVPLPMMICEYRTYLPSIGWVIGCVTAVWMGAEAFKERFPGGRKTVIVILTGIVVFFSVLTFARNHVWRDRVRMWEDVTAKSPNNARAHYNLGLAWVTQGQMDKAAEVFQVTLRLNPNHTKARNNLGLIYGRQGRLEEATQEFQKALSVRPDDPNLHYNLGIVFGQGRRLDEAARSFQKVLTLNPRDADAHNSLGVVYGQQGRLEEAIREFQAALKLNPDHVKARSNLRKAQGQGKN